MIRQYSSDESETQSGVDQQKDSLLVNRYETEHNSYCAKATIPNFACIRLMPQ